MFTNLIRKIGDIKMSATYLCKNGPLATSAAGWAAGAGPASYIEQHITSQGGAVSQCMIC